MSFGLRTWGAGGTLELDTDVFTYQVLHSQTYSLLANRVITVPVSGFVPASCSAVILPIGNVDSSRQYCYDAMPYVTVTNGSITIRSSNPSEPDPNNIGSNISFRLLVMRYKN